MKINKEILKELKPCLNRWENFLKYYSDFNGSFDEFIDLENISYEDKIWVAKRILNKNQLCHFGLLCAESVLSIFESKYPQDKRVGDCIRYLTKIKDFCDISEDQKIEILNHRSNAYDAASAAASAASSAYASDAADAAYAAYNAANAANAAYNAYNAANDAYAAYAACNAACNAANAANAAYNAYNAANDAYNARKMQQELNLEFLKVAASL